MRILDLETNPPFEKFSNVYMYQLICFELVSLIISNGSEEDALKANQIHGTRLSLLKVLKLFAGNLNVLILVQSLKVQHI